MEATANGETITQGLRVGITDVNDNDPTFPNQYYYATVDEGATTTNIKTISATDADGTFTAAYALTNDFGKFALASSSTGQINVNTAIDLDNATNDAGSYTIEVSRSPILLL